VYEVSVSHDEGVARLMRSDPEGRIYIGRTRNLRNRLRGFLRGIEQGRGHAGANIVYDMSPRQKRWFAAEVLEGRLRYRFVEAAESKQDRPERKAILDYLHAFGELPPFNGVLPGGKGSRAQRRRARRRTD